MSRSDVDLPACESCDQNQNGVFTRYSTTHMYEYKCERCGTHYNRTMSDTRRKGKNRERQAEDYYNQAGYQTEICRGHRWGRTDWFGLFDLMALQPGEPVHYVQVKSNQVDNVEGWIRDADRFIPREHVVLDYLVCHDYAGWRLLRRANTPQGYRVVFDGRETSGNMGEDLVEFLRFEL